jgi:hypothetical protein
LCSPLGGNQSSYSSSGWKTSVPDSELADPFSEVSSTPVLSEQRLTSLSFSCRWAALWGLLCSVVKDFEGKGVSWVAKREKAVFQASWALGQ